MAIVGTTVASVIWLHSAARSSPDSWPASVAAGTTAALALITLWYAYLTHKLLGAQRSAARVAGWEAALRDLSLYLNRERTIFWAAAEYFPADRPDSDPPGLMALAESKVAFARTRDHLLEILGLLPRGFAGTALGLAARLVDAESEITALFRAIVDAMEAGREAGRTTWSWAEAEQAHDASDDPDRSEVWADVVCGRYFHVAEEAWDELSTAIDRHLTDLSFVCPKRSLNLAAWILTGRIA